MSTVRHRLAATAEAGAGEGYAPADADEATRVTNPETLTGGPKVNRLLRNTLLFLATLSAALGALFAAPTYASTGRIQRAPAFDLPLWFRRWMFVLRRDIRWAIPQVVARALALYCWVTEPEARAEGLRMCFWRWFAVVHLALKERTQRNWALANGDREYWTSGGPVTLRPSGRWQPVPAGAAGITRVGQVSPLYYKKVAGGLPVLQDLSFFPGNVFFVDSGTTVQGGATAGFGYHPDSPVLLIDTAIGLCTASQADVIFVLPGHAEDLSATALIDADEQGISIIGVGRGPDRPTLTYDHADALFSIGASGVMVKNIVFFPSVTIVTAAIDVETTFTDVVLEDLECIPGEAADGTDEFVDAIQNQITCTRLQILGLKYSHHASCNGTQSAIHMISGSDRVHIKDFWIEITGAAAVAGIENITALVTRILIEHGTITTDAEPGIELVANSTGSIEHVHIFGDLATIDAATVADLCAHHEVFYTEVGNEASTRVKTESVDD